MVQKGAGAMIEQHDEELVIGYPGDAPGVEGSGLGPCRDCKRPLWFSPGSQRAIAAGAIPLCYTCARKLTRNDFGVKFGGFL